MTKATETGGFLFCLVAIWVLLYTGIIPTSAAFQDKIVPVLPWWLLVSFGAYALFALGYDVATFNDKPEKYRELMQQVVEAKTDLRARGIDISE